MSISHHPGLGAVVLCDFNQGFREPEMVKRRLAVVISPRIGVRAGLCTIVPLSTAPPAPEMPYHCRIRLDPPLPAPWDAQEHWVKGDMVCAVGFHRLDLVRLGKAPAGDRLYHMTPISAEDLRRVRACVLCSLGLASLKRGLP